jgi:membrane protein implicated in regulation of membrane protease activity
MDLNWLKDGLKKAEVRAILAIALVFGLITLCIGLCAFVPELRQLSFTTLANLVFSVVAYYFGTKTTKTSEKGG